MDYQKIKQCTHDVVKVLGQIGKKTCLWTPLHNNHWPSCGGVIIWYEKITTLHEEILELSRIIIRYTGHTTGMSDTSNKIDNIYKESTKLTEEYTKLIKY